MVAVIRDLLKEVAVGGGLTGIIGLAGFFIRWAFVNAQKTIKAERDEWFRTIEAERQEAQRQRDENYRLRQRWTEERHRVEEIRDENEWMKRVMNEWGEEEWNKFERRGRNPRPGGTNRGRGPRRRSTDSEEPGLG